MDYLQRTFCAHEGCGTCVVCVQIRTQQHHAVVWISPEKQYTLDDLSILQERLNFALAEDELSFFILQKADTLSSQCANSLLKSIEEPPRGYKFILCAERLERILPTIQSRCIIQSFAHERHAEQHKELFSYFSAIQHPQASLFLQYIQKSTINEFDSIDLVDSLLAFWIKMYTEAPASHASKKVAEKRIDILKHALMHSPMPGSSKLFWKNLYSQFYSC
jgi:DNA polymerase-3 subunit delta'